ncbi:oligosaccharide repeat unit polymerase [Metasolibacillus sp.]|uniref:oligosaccharide repeat unit polymerase n=1 Tax=Metasolibacillus sp. TaxID=2703680 RepID=UPI0025FB06CB|nr:oligosaccharide repeat unit polymerase [Metasolibacillus sp.]MCT6923384.1 oligosaccharide repeat unit polymerase [Metasolibacillus sp.]MCT6939893.1 oligosaccharide repeat unit polymerase [Metasolibacillus sp.]
MKKKDLINIFMLMVFKGILEIGYIIFVSPIFAEENFFIEYSFGKFILSNLLTLVIAFLIIFYIAKQQRASQIIVYILLIFLFIPIMSLYWLQNQPTKFAIAIFLSYFIINCILIIIPRIKIYSLTKKESKVFLIFLFIGITGIVYGLLILTGGLSRINLNLLDVYETREAYSSNEGRILGYLLPWQAHVVNLLLLTLALYNRKYFLATIALAMQIFLFSMTNFKSHLFAPVVILMFYFFQKTKWKDYFLLIMSTGATLLVSVSLVLFTISNNLMLVPSIFIRRLFFVPAQLHYQYYDFFEFKRKFYLEHSILENVIPSYYNTSPVTYMALEFFKRDFAPNVGYWGDAYVNFGFSGIFIFSILLAVILLIIDSVSNKIPLFLTMSILVIPGMSLINSAFFTSLLTHGILFCILLLWIVNGIYRKNKLTVHGSN